MYSGSFNVYELTLSTRCVVS